MRVVVGGASGFLGSALSDALAGQGHQVIRLVRQEAAHSSESRWDPASGQVDQSVIDAADVVVNVAGAPVARVPWTEGYSRTFTASRVDTTRTLALAVARAGSSTGGPPSLLAQSGVAGYGDRGNEVVTEETPTDAPTFMGEVVRRWEDAAEPARAAGARVVHLRTSVVLDASGSALKPMLLPFKLGLGGRIGSGRQYFSTISLEDWVAAVTYLAQHQELAGPVNLSGPEPATNAEFTEALGRALHRPAFLRVPAFPIRKVGPIGGEMLSSARVVPRRLLDAGFAFAHRDINEQLTAALH